MLTNLFYRTAAPRRRKGSKRGNTRRPPVVIISPSGPDRPKTPNKQHTGLVGWFERLPGIGQVLLGLGLIGVLILVGLNPPAAHTIILFLSTLKALLFGGDSPCHG